MYIFELIIKKFKEKKEKKRNIIRNSDNVSFEYEKCEHTFMPIDSTGKIFACSKCGELLKK